MKRACQRGRVNSVLRSLVACTFLACGSEPGDTTRLDSGIDAFAPADSGTRDSAGQDDAGNTDAAADSGNDAGLVIPEDLAARYCDAYDAYGTMCMTDGAGADCDEGESCVVEALRADLREPVVMCLEARECGDSDAPCFDIDTFGRRASAAAAEFITTCVARREECSNSFNELHCTYAVLSDETLERYSQCLRTNCAGIDFCIGRIIGCIEEE